jgi:hypothetical protein
MNEEYLYSSYLVAYIDILGQRPLLRQLIQPTSEDDKQKV